jgi:2-keto-3-deoxy-6-phosphogluconate aldolase
VSDYLSAGASAVALGGSIFTLKRMANQECFSIQKDIEEFMLAVNKNYSNIRI